MAAEPCCGPTRRQLLTGAAALATAGLVELGTAQYAFAGTRPAGDLLVVVSLRGGADGLSLVPPLADAAYAAARPDIAVPSAEAIRLDRQFGLHPALRPLVPLWQSRQLAVVHAVGDNDGSRSHFEATDGIERGVDPRSAIATGWLDRHLTSRGGAPSPLPALAIAATPPVSLRGPAPDLALTSVTNALVHCPPAVAADVGAALAGMYDGVSGPVAGAGRTTLEALRRLAPIRGQKHQPSGGATYPDDHLGRSLAQVAQVAKARLGLEVACVSSGGWDTHAGMGAPGGGYMNGLVGGLGAALAAFAADMGPLMRTTTLVTVSEFGRRLQQNASGGVDHGHGGVMLLLGGGIRGGRVYGRWPGLGPKDLDDGDVRATTDYRDVLGEVVRQRLGNGRLDTVFPGHRTRELGLCVAR